MSTNENDAMRLNDVIVEANNLICYTHKSELRMQSYGMSKNAKKRQPGKKSTEVCSDLGFLRGAPARLQRLRRGRRGGGEAGRARRRCRRDRGRGGRVGPGRIRAG